jgi:hypothetical protein
LWYWQICVWVIADWGHGELVIWLVWVKWTVRRMNIDGNCEIAGLEVSGREGFWVAGLVI